MSAMTDEEYYVKEIMPEVYDDYEYAVFDCE